MFGADDADKFPIIDSIMRKVIPIYDYLYRSDKVEYSKYKTESNLYKYRTAEYKDIQPSVIEYYKDYVIALRRIRDAVNRNVEKEKQKITVTEIEQLLWWFYRGIADNVDEIKNEK